MNIRRNSLINLGGSVIGLILFAAMTPLYYQVIGGERYGILSIILAFMVFFVSFDFGMGAALSYRVAGEARGETRRQSEYFWTATAISLPVGLAIGAVLFGMVGGGFGALFRLSEEVAGELMKSVAWLFAMGIATVLQSTVGGLFKGREQFLVNATLGALGIIFSILFPVAAAIAFGPSLQNLIIATLASRLATLIPSILIAHYAMLGREPPRFSWRAARSLLGYGSWMSFAGIVELAMSSADRLVLGITIGPAAVPFYAIPFSVVSRALLFPNSLMSAVLPQMIARQDRAELQSKALDVLLLLTPLFVAGILLSPQFMTLWMGAAFAAKATLPLQILGAAFWVEVVSSVLYFQILAEGKPKRNFYVGLASAPPYLMALVAFTTWWGVVGASLAYLVKASICLVGRMLATKSGLPLLRKSSVDALLVAAVLTIALFQDRLHGEHVLGALVLLLSLALKIGTHRSYLSMRKMRQRRA